MMECTQHLVVSRQSTSGDPLCHHPGITKNRCPGAQCRASSADSVGRRCQIMHDLGHTAGMDQPYSHVREVRKEEVQARFGTNDRKGLTVNVVAVTQVVNHVMLSRRLAIALTTLVGLEWNSDRQMRQTIHPRSCGCL